ncbi:MAG: GAF domain-containing protein [Flavobacteriaceae bacterium]|nr:GAF domain-containing protein [Flavobacteriaceae bacterium]
MSQKLQKYERIYTQLEKLFEVTDNPASRMATMVAVLHHKMKNFYWTGFYLLQDGELLVNVYQGALACQLLKKNVGVCWASINAEKTLIVPNVHEFEGHIACSSLTNSEIVVPLWKDNQIIGCLDIDSKEFANFDNDDAIGLEKILTLL